MTAILIFFLLLVIAGLLTGLGFLGFHFFQLYNKAKKLDGELATQKTQYQAVVNKYNEDIGKWQGYSNSLKAEIQRLAKWKTVADAEAKAADLIQTANATLDKANAQANSAILAAQQQINAFLADANAKGAALKSEAQQQSAQIISAANQKAQEIAGEAYETKKNAAFYEYTAQAMKNIIQGYGDQYIIPEESLLDELAEDFGYTEAGQELKIARERTKAMIGAGTAATCDYAERTRRETAIHFVLDAFNGKVDSILSRTKHDNAGTLERQVRDAFMLVNFNGKAFREARITDEYLAARLDELKWGSIAQQLAVKQREEQRRIKEQVREEERARKEYERAMRESAKQEGILRTAMEKAKSQMEHASAEQKAKYEQQLQELADKLKQAEERNHRAMSMAQQTKQGNVYVILNIGSFGENVYKIGLTRRLDPQDRVRELGDASVPFEFDVHALIFSGDAPALEKRLHKHFVTGQVNKVNHRKEFFRAELSHIREELEKLGLDVKWTMKAAAKEYRETLAIEKAIKDNPAMREAWIKRQLDLEQMENDSIECVEIEGDEDEMPQASPEAVAVADLQNVS